MSTIQAPPDPWSYWWVSDGEDPHVPPAHWDQSPSDPRVAHMRAHRTIRWGDTVLIQVPQLVGGTASRASGYVLDCSLRHPATCLVRLSATSPDLAALDPAWVCDWQLQIGVGSSAQIKRRRIQIAPESDPAVDTDILLTWPLELLRVSATATVGPGASTVNVHCTAHVAPFTFEGGQVR